MDEFTIAINPEIAQRISAEAQNMGQDEAEWIRNLLMKHFEKLEQDESGPDNP